MAIVYTVSEIRWCRFNAMRKTMLAPSPYSYFSLNRLCQRPSGSAGLWVVIVRYTVVLSGRDIAIPGDVLPGLLLPRQFYTSKWAGWNRPYSKGYCGRLLGRFIIAHFLFFSFLYQGHEWLNAPLNLCIIMFNFKQLLLWLPNNWSATSFVRCNFSSIEYFLKVCTSISRFAWSFLHLYLFGQTF